MGLENVTRRGLLKAAAATLPAAGLSASWLRSAEAQTANGTITVALSDNPLTCDPVNMSSHDSQIISQMIFENLVEFDIDGVLKPQLAKALPTISADKLVYTFELRDDVQFQNGQPFTSEDVKYSLEWSIDPKNKTSRGILFNRITKVETDGPHRCHVHLSEPFAPWLYFLTKHMGIWPKDSREANPPDYFRRSPIGVGTGPGIFEEWRPNDFVSLKRNPNYWRKGYPKWERIVVKIVPEDATRIAYLLSGQADIIGAPPPRDFAKLKTRKGIKGEARPTWGGWTVMLTNNARAPFDDLNFRLAVSHAIDRKTICEKIYFGLVQQATVPAPPDSWWYDKQADTMVEYNVEKAKAYLAKSKYAEGAEFELLNSAVPYLLDGKDACIFIQSELAKIGIKVNLRLAETAVMSPLMFRGEYQAMFRNLMSPGEATYQLMTNFTPNQFMTKVSSWTDPKFVEILKEAFGETDQEKLKPLYAQLMRILGEQQPYCWIGFFAAANLWRDRVKDFKPSLGLAVNVRDSYV